VGSQYLSSGRV